MAELILGYSPRRWAIPFHEARQRFLCLVLHRRAGKTTSILNHHQRACTSPTWERARLRSLDPGLTDQQIDKLCKRRNYAHILPTLTQNKLSCWELLKDIASPILSQCKVNESELSIRYPGGAKLRLFGSDNPDALRNTAFSGVSFDEWSLHPPNVFSEILSKSLADHLGYAIFAGTIKGHDQLYQTYESAKADPDWFSIWQPVDVSLRTEQDVAIRLIRQAMTDDQKLVSIGIMTQEEYEQEWYLSDTAAIKGSYYGHLMAAAKADGRVCRVPYDPALPVDTDWDLGMDDSTSIVFSQSLRSREVRIVDYLEIEGQGLQPAIAELKRRPYLYGQHWGPHDIEVREWTQAGKTRRQVARDLGFNFDVTPKLGLQEGIDCVRRLLPRCWFDDVRTSKLVEALTRYHKPWNERTQSYGTQPVHDQWSHGADAFRGLAVRHQPPASEEPKRRRDVLAGTPNTPSLGWMR